MKKAFSFNTSEVLLHKNVIVLFLPSVICSSFIFLSFFFKIDVSDIFWKSENFGPEKAHEKLNFGID